MFHSTIILAGGEGSRLGCNLPKALYPFTPIAKKTLLQYKLECCRSHFPECTVGILINRRRRQEIDEFLETNSYFGIPKSSLYILEQHEEPYTLNGETFFSSEGVEAKAPNGNGGLFDCTDLKTFLKSSSDAVSITSIDNPLIDPFAPEFFTLPEKDCLIGVFEKTDKDQVGTVSDEGEIVDYTHTLEAHPHGNLGAYRFSKSLLLSLSEGNDLKYHEVLKKTQRYDPVSGETVLVEAIKKEKFITDVPTYAEKKALVQFDREASYGAIKFADDIETVQRRFLTQHKEALLHAGLVASGDVELHPAYLMISKDALYDSLKDKEPLSGYYSLE